jgi:hypothetical protein
MTEFFALLGSIITIRRAAVGPTRETPSEAAHSSVEDGPAGRGGAFIEGPIFPVGEPAEIKPFEEITSFDGEESA